MPRIELGDEAMMSTHWRLWVESGGGVVVQLPLLQGSYRIGTEPGADFALARLSGALDVNDEGVTATLASGKLKLTAVGQEVDGMQLRVEPGTASPRRTQSLPGAASRAHEMEPLRVIDPKGKLPPRTIM